MNEPPISNPFDEEEEKNNQPYYYSAGTGSPDENESGGRVLVWLMLGVAAMGCGLLLAGGLFFYRAEAQDLYSQYFPSLTPTASRTPVPTRTPTATPTPNQTATQQVLNVTSTAQVIQTSVAEVESEWKIVISDPFDNNNEEWPTGARDGEFANTDRKVEDGKYVWDIFANKGVISWVGARNDPVADFYVSVEAKKVGGTSEYDFGLVFREDEDVNFYYFGVDEDGFFVLLNYNDEWIDIVVYESSSAILPGEVNRIAVLARGSYFVFLINDEVVAEASDDHIPSGTTAIGIQIHGEGLQAIFEFDNFELRTP